MIEYCLTTPEEYDLQTFFDKVPEGIDVWFNSPDRMGMEKKDCWHGWIMPNDPNDVIPISLEDEDYFSPEEKEFVLQKIPRPKFFIILASRAFYIEQIIETVANSDEILVHPEMYEYPGLTRTIFTGKEFVAFAKSRRETSD